MRSLFLLPIVLLLVASCTNSTDYAQTETGECEVTGYWHHIKRLDALPDKSDRVRWWPDVIRLNAESPDTDYNVLWYWPSNLEPYFNEDEPSGRTYWSYTDENKEPTRTVTNSIQITYGNDAVDNVSFHEGCDAMLGTKTSPIRNGTVYMFRFDTVEDYVPWYKFASYLPGDNLEFDPPKPSRFDRE